MEEIWKDDIEFIGFYQVSNLGNYKRLERTVTYVNGKVAKYSEMQMKKFYDKDGYVYYSIYINNKRYYRLAHRIVAINFIENPDNKPMVNHLDGDKENNLVYNLEWCDASENNKHAHSIGLKNQKSFNNNASKLTEEDIDLIMSLKGKLSQIKIAKEFNVSNSTISYLHNYKTHVNKNGCDS